MLRLIRKIELADRPFHTSVSEDGRRFVACTKSGKLWLFDNDLRQLCEMKCRNDVMWVQLNEDGSVLLIGYEDHIAAYATGDGFAPIFKLGSRMTHTDCSVFRSNEHVVCVASWDREPKLTAWDLRSTAVVDEIRLPNRGGAGYMLVSHPEREAIALIAYSGQSEEWLFWAHYSHGKLRVFGQPEIEDVSLPYFHPTGREFVSYHERLGLCRMRFPSGELVASIQPEQAFPDNPQDSFGYEVHFFRDDRFLAWQCNLALYEFDLANATTHRRCINGS